MLKHKFYGVVEQNKETQMMNKKFANHTAKNGTTFVSLKGELKEVSKDMLFEVPA